MKRKNIFFALGALLLLLPSCTSGESTSTSTPDSSTNSSVQENSSTTSYDSSSGTSDSSSSTSDSSVIDSSSSFNQDSSSSSDITNTTNYGVTILTSRYGYAEVDTDIAQVGETINVSVTCTAGDGVVSAGIKVNGVEQLALDGDGIIQVEMEEGGLLVEPLFKSVLTEDVSVSSSDVKIVVTDIENGEYRIDDGPWQISNVFSGLTATTNHTIEARIKAHDGLYASDALSLDVNTKSENTIASNILAQLQDGIALKGTYTVARWWNGEFYDETIYNQELYIANNQYFLDSCFADDGVQQNHIDYRRGNDGNAYSAILDYTNNVVLSNTGINFYNNYYNPFEEISESNLKRVDENRFLLTISDSTLSNYFTQYFTRYSAPIDYLYINVDEYGDVSGIDLYSTHTGTMVGMTTEYYEHVSLEKVSYDEIGAVQPITASFDTSNLEWVLQSLQQQNYTAEIEITHDWYDNVHASYQAFGNGVIITPESGYPYGYLDTEDGLTLFDVNITSDGNYVLKGRQGYPVSGQTVSSLLPAFDVSADLFSIYGSSTYTLRNIYNLYDYAYRLAADVIVDDYYIDYIVDGSLDININSDNVVISYDWYDIYSFHGTVTATITNIGQTESAYDLGTYEDFSSEITKWSEFSTGLYDALASKYGFDPDEEIPFYYDEDHPWSTWEQKSTGTIYLYMSDNFSSSTALKEFCDAYGAILIEAGFSYTATGTSGSGAGWYQKNGATLTFSLNTYYNSFTLMFG